MANFNASRITASVFGVFGGILGLEHGIGEILQGNAAAATTVINAYKAPGLLFPFGVEPAMTLIHNYLITGILAVITGLLIMIWSAFFIQNKGGGIILYLLAILSLLVGCGFAPIFVLLLTGIAGFKIKSAFKLWRKTPAGMRQVLARLWPWLLGAMFLVTPVSVIWGYFAGMNQPLVNMNASIILAMACGWTQLLFIILTSIAAMARDSLKNRRKYDLQYYRNHTHCPRYTAASRDRLLPVLLTMPI